MTDQSKQPIRIPNLPMGKLVDENGHPTDNELTFRQALITSLQNYMGNEGLVSPTQNDADKTTIQDNVDSQGTYTCELGTILYVKHPSDYTQDKVMIAVRDDNTYPSTPPKFKTITLV